MGFWISELSFRSPTFKTDFVTLWFTMSETSHWHQRAPLALSITVNRHHRSQLKRSSINAVSRKIKLAGDATKFIKESDGTQLAFSHFPRSFYSNQINNHEQREKNFFRRMFSYFMRIGKLFFFHSSSAACSVDEKWFYPLHSLVCASSQHAKCIWWNSWKWPGKSGRGFFIALYYTSDKLQFSFFVTRLSAVSFFQCIFCNLYAGASDAVSRSLLVSLFWPSIHLFPERCKKLVFIPNCLPMQFFRCRAIVFLHFRQTHSHMQRHRQYSSTRGIFFPPLAFHSFCIFALDAIFPCCQTRYSTRWWRDGYTVWFGRLCVILIFYARLSGHCWWDGEWNSSLEWERSLFFILLVWWWICWGDERRVSR